MPTIAELLGKRKAESPVGQRFGLTPRTLEKHGQLAQTVVEVVAILSDGARAAVDVKTATVVRTGNGRSQEVVEEKTGRRIVNLQETLVR
jgi:hypothetical protein